MYLKLDPDYADPRTQMALPDAVMVIADCEFRMRAGDTRVIVRVYANPAAIETAQPLAEYPIALSIVERDTQMPGLLGALYAVVSQRPELEGAELIP